jgi:hypothetical protein
MMTDVNKDKSPSFTVVSEKEAKTVPYPYVYVNDDGSVRELSQAERTYLETSFHPADGASPYIKSSYDKKDGWGSVAGFCRRSKIPPNHAILDAPVKDPTEESKEKFFEKEIRLAQENGFDVIKNADGSLTFSRRKP